VRLAILAPGNSIHTIKWVNALANRGHQVHLLTMHKSVEDLHENIAEHLLQFPSPAGYYLNVFLLRRLLNRLMPDFLHAHYASGYGTLARLSRYKPLLLSVWGSDVYDFPEESCLNKYILRKNLASADRISSTSHCMKIQTEKYMKHKLPIEVIPFGVNTEVFCPQPNRDIDKITIGMVKKMAPQYGPKFLMEAFDIINKKYPNSRLILIGGGPQEEELKRLAHNLGIAEYCNFVGSVLHREVPRWLNQFDIYCAPSTMESFGVAVIEASACGLPVIVSRVGGLPEVVQENKTGIIIPPKDVNALVQALETLIKNKELRISMGNAGRIYVQQHYEWEFCVDKMEQLYYQAMESYDR
jgi:glycosyltransferase involved in cell wall biosynthesis